MHFALFLCLKSYFSGMRGYFLQKERKSLIFLEGLRLLSEKFVYF